MKAIPEAKRKIIGRVVEVFDEEALKLDDVKWLAQGTIYPDVIESAASATGKAHVIKSHRQRGWPAERDEDGLLEPLRELFKDEVRKIGPNGACCMTCSTVTLLPGPGLMRVLGEVKKVILRPAVPVTLSSSKSCTKLTCITKSARRSPCSCRFVPSA